MFHTYAYLGANAGGACLAIGPAVQHATNPTVAVGYGAATVHYILPRSDLRPEDDVYYRYETTGTIYGPWMGYGARAFNKFLNRVTILGTGVTAGDNITISYQLDDDTSTTTLALNAIDYGINEANILGTVSFFRIRYVITMNTQDVQTTPIMNAATMHATLNPPRRKTWKPMISLKPNQLLRDGMEDRQDVTTLRNALYSAASDRVTMVDRENNSYIVRILDLQELQLGFSTEGGAETDNQVLQLTMAEISPVSSSLPVAKYTQAAYSQGYRYS